MMNIRHADNLDLPWLLEQCVAFSDFYGSKIALIEDKVHAWEFLEKLVKNHLVLIAEDGKPKGFIAGVVQPHHFNPKIKLLAELLWWVPEQYRGTRAGAMLLDEFMAFGQEHCDWITFALEEITPISDKALLKRGFKLTERAYLWQR